MANKLGRAERTRRLSPACRKIQQRLVFIEELPASDADAVCAHLNACVACGQIERLFRGCLASLRIVPTPEPDDPYWARLTETVMARIRSAVPPV
jgi:hypothetical protein